MQVLLHIVFFLSWEVWECSKRTLALILLQKHRDTNARCMGECLSSGEGIVWRMVVQNAKMDSNMFSDFEVVLRANTKGAVMFLEF